MKDRDFLRMFLMPDFLWPVLGALAGLVLGAIVGTVHAVVNWAAPGALLDALSGSVVGCIIGAILGYLFYLLWAFASISRLMWKETFVYRNFVPAVCGILGVAYGLLRFMLDGEVFDLTEIIFFCLFMFAIGAALGGTVQWMWRAIARVKGPQEGPPQSTELD